MDNAPYLYVTNPEGKVPNIYTKGYIIAWLYKHEIDHTVIVKQKKVLLQEVNTSEHSKTQVFRIDIYLYKSGQHIL